MAMFLISNQHQPEVCAELGEELESYYKYNPPKGALSAYTNCRFGEHRVFFLVEADTPSKALQSIPAGYARTSNEVTQVTQEYSSATEAK